MPQKRFRKPNIYRPQLAVDIYVLAKQGMSLHKIERALGIKGENVLADWAKKYEEVQYALDKAKHEMETKGKTFVEYVYRHLPADLRDLWDQIEFIEEARSGRERVEALLAPQSTQVRQHLFIHALVSENFNVSEACRKLCLSSTTVDDWKEDPAFAKLLDQVNFHKKNFFEEGLVKLVREGNVLATMFVNRTINRDRGYSEKVIVEHTGTIHHTFTMEQILPRLSLDTRKELLGVIRQIKQVQPAEPEKTLGPGGNGVEARTRGGIAELEDWSEGRAGR